MKYIKKFIELSKDDAHIAGGKGASLGEMMNNNIPVPDGYVVTADTFDQFLAETDLTQELQAILDTVDTKAIHSVEHASEKIQILIKSVEIPEDIALEILSQFKELDAKYVAVRSSATAEDGADHAWAGQLDSYLNTTKENLLEMVQSCWASLFTSRAIFYRFEKGLYATHISVAVVVQKMINSEKSGIAFSVHPVTEDYNQIIIEAGLGLGEAIVSGSVTPDSYVVTKEPQKIIDINVNTQNKALYRGIKKTEHGFNEWKELTETEADRQVLSEDQILDLSDIIITIENHYGFPCDIEWAFEDGTFYIVQSRPITTLKSNQSKSIKNTDNNGDVNVEKYIGSINKKDITKQEGTFSLLIFFSLLPEGFPPYTSKYYNFNFKNFLYITKPGYGILFFSIEKYMETSRVSFDRFLKLENNEDLQESKDYERASNKIFNLYEKTDLFSLKNLEEKELTDLIKKSYKLYWDLLSSSIFSEAVYDDLIKELYKKVGGREDDLTEFVEKVALLSFESISLRFDRQLLDFFSTEDVKNTIWVFSDYNDAVDEAGFNQKIKDYIEEKGGLNKIKTSIKKTEQDILNNLKIQEPYYQKLPHELKKLFDFIQISMKYRDVRKKELQKVITLISYSAKAIFYKNNLLKELVTYSYYKDYFENMYKNPGYIDELEKRKNSVVYMDNPDTGAIFEYSDPDKAINSVYSFLDISNANNKEIKGSPACKGVVKGRVRIILSESDFGKFQNGDILVTSMTRPEFVPLMKKSSAVITDEGGVTCHAAIISRELNIPCIIGTNAGTRLLKDGDMVEVNANEGIVRIIS